MVPHATSTSCSGQGFSTCYKTFAIDYLTQKYVDSGTPIANAVYASHGLDNPTQIVTSSAQTYYYLDARGLYADYLEAETAQAISDACGTCPSTSSKADCVLPLVPFAAINTTELADWTSCTAATGTCTDATTTGMIVYPAVGHATPRPALIVAAMAHWLRRQRSRSPMRWRRCEIRFRVAIADPVNPNDAVPDRCAAFFHHSGVNRRRVFSVTLGNTANTADNGMLRRATGPLPPGAILQQATGSFPQFQQHQTMRIHTVASLNVLRLEARHWI